MSIERIPASPRPGATRLRLGAALLVVWMTFGAAYIAIKVGVMVVPPFLFSGARFILAGAALLAWCAAPAGGRLALRWRDLGVAALSGAALFFVGQGSASLASTELDPGVVSVLVSTVPLWAAMMARCFQGARISVLAGAGLAAGFGGVCLLAFPAHAGLPLPPALAVTGGAVAWAGGTLVVAGSEMRRRPLLLAALQMLTGGTLQLLLGVATGETGHLHLATLTPQVIAAFGFLVVGSGLIGFPAFAWLIGASSPTVANTQAFVVPAVSLLLGWFLLGEPLTGRTLLASGVSLAGVALLVLGSARRTWVPAVEEAGRAEAA